jgi:hypothetical protein
VTHETSTDYAHPFRPPPIRWANAALGAVAGLGPLGVDLSVESLERAARRRTKLSDLGDASYREPLSRLVRSIEDEARLHPVGRLITRTRLVSALANRARLTALYRSFPEIDRQPLTRPIVIVGLPRTGTTLLHRLLAGDSGRMRALMSWEALMPAPLPGEEHPKARMLGAERGEKALKYLAPDFFAVHPIDALGPEEEILLLDLAFRSTVPEATMHVPSFAAWLEGVDQGPAYQDMARALKALSWQRRPAAREWRWVLKTPHHLEWLDELPKVLEDPVIVWTHRDPLEVVPSFCSMIAHGRGVFSDAVDPLEIGRSWLRKAQRMVGRAMDARPRLGEDRFVDIRYKDLIKDPVAAARVIQERAGLTFDEATEQRMRRTLEQEKKDRHGVHRYGLELFGLTPGDVNGALGRYREAYRV